MARPTLSPDRPTERLHMMVPSSFIEKVNDFRFASRIPTLSEAVRQLVERGLAAHETAEDKP